MSKALPSTAPSETPIRALLYALASDAAASPKRQKRCRAQLDRINLRLARQMAAMEAGATSRESGVHVLADFHRPCETGVPLHEQRRTAAERGETMRARAEACALAVLLLQERCRMCGACPDRRDVTAPSTASN